MAVIIAILVSLCVAAVEELLMNIEDGDTSSNSSSTTPSVGDAVHRDQLQVCLPSFLMLMVS